MPYMEARMLGSSSQVENPEEEVYRFTLAKIILLTISDHQWTKYGSRRSILNHHLLSNKKSLISDNG